MPGTPWHTSGADSQVTADVRRLSQDEGCLSAIGHERSRAGQAGRLGPVPVSHTIGRKLETAVMPEEGGPLPRPADKVS